MIFEQIPIGQMQNFAYLIGDKEAAIVDPGWDIDKLLAAAKKHDLNVNKILLTHNHYDHINGVKQLFDATDATIYVHEEDAMEIKKLGIEKIKTIKDNEIIEIGKIKVKVLHTPGHSSGSVCYLVDNKLITGDTVFVEAVGRVDLPGGNIGELYDSLQKLKELPGDTEIYPGHDYGSIPHSTIKHEKQNNPYMKASKEDFFRIR